MEQSSGSRVHISTKRSRQTAVPTERAMNRLQGACLGAYLWGILLVSSGAAGTPCEGAKLERFQSTQIEMGVPFKIILYAADEATAKGALDAAFSRIAELNDVLSDYDTHSELSRLSHSAPAAEGVPLGDDLWRVLARSQALARRTEGAFDVTVGPYVRLWRRARRQKEMPSPKRMREARAAVGYDLLVLDEHTSFRPIDPARHAARPGRHRHGLRRR